MRYALSNEIRKNQRVYEMCNIRFQMLNSWEDFYFNARIYVIARTNWSAWLCSSGIASVDRRNFDSGSWCIKYFSVFNWNVRNDMFKESDWTQFTDSLCNADAKLSWATHCQTLWDFPATQLANLVWLPAYPIKELDTDKNPIVDFFILQFWFYD